jgi:hypothetical protein
MPQFDEQHVKICGGTIVWDGITAPEKQEHGDNAGQPKWSLKVIFPPGNPDVALYDAMAQKTLRESQFKGVLPAGGYMPLRAVTAAEYGGAYTGWAVASFKTVRRCPDVYDENVPAQQLDPMQYGPLMYSGQQVDVLAHCYEFNQKSKGIAAGLDAFAIIASAQAPRIETGSGGIATAGAFGGGGGGGGGGAPAYGQQPPAQAQPAYAQQPPAQQQPAYAQQPPAQQQPAYAQQQHAQQQPAQQQPAYAQQPPAQQPTPQANPAYLGQGASTPAGGAPPAQAHNYLPQN